MSAYAFLCTQTAFVSSDALAKNVYTRMVDWLLQRVNNVFFRASRQNRITLLDLSGMERYQNNGFEQLTVNSLSERVHAFIYKHFFVDVQQDYEKQVGTGP